MRSWVILKGEWVRLDYDDSLFDGGQGLHPAQDDAGGGCGLLVVNSGVAWGLAQRVRNARRMGVRL